MRTARRYLAREIWRSCLVVLLALVGLFTFFALIEDLDSVNAQFSLWHLFYLQVLQLPTNLYELLPIGLLVGAVLALAGLAQRNELTILRVSGVSNLKLLAALWVITIPWVGGAFILSEALTPAMEIRASEAKLQWLGRSGGGRLNSGYWFKESSTPQGSESTAQTDAVQNDGAQPHLAGERIINITHLRTNGRVADIQLYEFSAKQALLRHSRARAGFFEQRDGQQTLVLEGIVQTSVDAHAVSALNDGQATTHALTQVTQVPRRTLVTTLSPERLIARILKPERMSISVLLDYIRYLDDNHLQTDRQVVALWRKIAYPFTLLVMMTIAAPIGFMQTRRGGVGAKVFLSILLGVGFFMVNQLALNVGMLGRWPPWFTALMPNIAALLLALGALGFMEKRQHLRFARHLPVPLPSVVQHAH